MWFAAFDKRNTLARIMVALDRAIDFRRSHVDAG